MRTWIPLMLLAACGTPSSSGDEAQAPPDPSKPDQVAVAIPTRIEARRITVVLGTQWRDKVVAEAISVDRSDPDAWVLRGGATLRICRRSRRCRAESGRVWCLFGALLGGHRVRHFAEPDDDLIAQRVNCEQNKPDDEPAHDRILNGLQSTLVPQELLHQLLHRSVLHILSDVKCSASSRPCTLGRFRL